MPFLRFTRDKRGYETTALVHTARHQGRSRQRVLYWFRTPPGVKVGRPALDEEAIRWIEEHNPDIEFDWPKILEAQPPPAPPADEGRLRKGRRDRQERRRQPAKGAPGPVRAEQPAAPGLPEATEALESETQADLHRPAPSDAEAEAPVAAEAASDASEARDVEEILEEEMAEAYEQLTHPDVEELIELPPPPNEQVVGHEQLIRLRARYAEILARINQRGGSAEQIEALRTQAETLNPDTWVTAEEARQGLERFEPTLRELRAALGLKRRRRSRRRSRRPQGGPAETPGNSSNDSSG